MFDRKVIAISAVLASASGIATAANERDFQGFYAGAGVGQITLKDSSIGFDADDTAFKIFGGYSINKWLSAEASYMDGGSPSQRINGIDLTVNTSAFEAAMVGSINVTPQFSLFGRLGALFWNEESKTFRSSFKDSGNDLSYGIGAGVHFGRNAIGRVEWQSADTELKAQLISASFIWQFNQ